MFKNTHNKFLPIRNLTPFLRNKQRDMEYYVVVWGGISPQKVGQVCSRKKSMLHVTWKVNQVPKSSKTLD